MTRQIRTFKAQVMNVQSEEVVLAITSPDDVTTMKLEVLEGGREKVLEMSFDRKDEVMKLILNELTKGWMD